MEQSHDPGIPPEVLLGPLNEVERKYAPPRLFLAGRRDLLQEGPRVAVAGSRHPSPAGLAFAEELSGFLVRTGAVVVSGLAEGIDTRAHRTTMESGGSTIAVVGTPLDRSYPATNRGLQEEIARRHLVVSEFAPGTPISRGNFPRRNRTMALISHASVIVEASDTSGSLSQGWEAIRLGRPLFIAPSLVERSDLEWPDKMMGYGAIVLVEMAAIIDYLPSGGSLAGDVAF